MIDHTGYISSLILGLKPSEEFCLLIILSMLSEYLPAGRQVGKINPLRYISCMVIEFNKEDL